MTGNKDLIFETINANKKGLNNYEFQNYEDIINKYISLGYSYSGFIPKEYNGLGVPIKIDLIFQK